MIADPATGAVLGEWEAGQGWVLALAFHPDGDQTAVHTGHPSIISFVRTSLDEAQRVLVLANAPLFAVRAADRSQELVRRGMSLFALPQHAADGSRALWETADHIWTALGDTSRDVNWYTKRAILSSVHSSTVLFWLGDQDPRHQATWDFLDRRIEGENID